MKKLLPSFLHLMLIAFIISITQNAKAQTYTNDDTNQYYFVVWTHSGETFNYPLSERPKVSQTTSSLVLTTTETIVDFSKEDVWKFTISPQEQVGIENTTCVNAMVTQHGNSVYLSNCKVDSKVNIYSSNGILYSRHKVSKDGTLTIDLDILNKGVYIISTESINYKIIKK